jgi:hypothetical protein
MSWKDDLKELVESQKLLTRNLVLAQARLVTLDKKMDRLMKLAETQSRSADRMADRMIEMAMVNQGKSDMAAAHRRSLEETEPEGVDPWQEPKTQWPPPGCDAVNMP